MASNDRIDDALEKLTEISSELKAIIAVHEQRLNQQEKDKDVIFKLLENRRKEMDDKINEVYVDMSSKDNSILEHIEQLRKESAEQHKTLNEKISKLEKFIWLAIGGGMVLVWILSYIANYFKIMGH